MKILERQEITAAKTLEILSKTEKERNLVHEQQVCLDFLRKHLKFRDSKEFEHVKEELKGIKDFKEHQLDKLVEVLPITEEQVYALFSKERIKLEKEDVKRIIDLCTSVIKDGKK